MLSIKIQHICLWLCICRRSFEQQHYPFVCELPETKKTETERNYPAFIKKEEKAESQVSFELREIFFSRG